MALHISILVISNSDSDGDSLFITQEPTQMCNRQCNINDRPILDLDIEDLLNSSTDSAVGSIEELFPAHGSNAEGDDIDTVCPIVNIPSPKPYKPQREEISEDDWLV